jgi:hypothetical protein
VAPERLGRWLAGFAERHGDVAFSLAPGGPGAGTGTAAVSATVIVTVTATALDGALAECRVPFPPLILSDSRAGAELPAALVAHALRERRVGVLLARLGGHAAGVFDGPRLVDSKVGARHVQGRTAAGGWSQQRFARRREGQARVAAGAAADVAARVLLPAAADLDALVVGGDRRAVAAVLEDPRLGALRGLVTEPFLDVPDPRQRVLEAAPAAFRAVRIRVLEPGVEGGAAGEGPEET